MTGAAGATDTEPGLAEFRDFLIQTGIEAVVAENDYNFKIAQLFVNHGFKVSADGTEMTYHGLLERPHRAEMLEALKMMVKENAGIVCLGAKEHEAALYEYFAVTAVDGVQSPTSGKTLLNHQEMFRIKSGPEGMDIKHQIESRFGNEVSALGLNRKGLMSDLQTATMLCAAEEGLGLESQWSAKIDLPSGLKGGRFDRVQVNELIKQGIEPIGLATLYPKVPNGYERFEIKAASLTCTTPSPTQQSPTPNPEATIEKQSTVQKSLPPPLPQTRRSVLDEIDSPEVKEKKEPKSKAKRKSDRELEAGS